MITGLFRILLIFIAALLLRRVVRGAFASMRGQFGSTQPRRPKDASSKDFDSGQKIEEAEFEELD